jgi:hypothetical protein
VGGEKFVKNNFLTSVRKLPPSAMDCKLCADVCEWPIELNAIDHRRFASLQKKTKIPRLIQKKQQKEGSTEI